MRCFCIGQQCMKRCTLGEVSSDHGGLRNIVHGLDFVATSRSPSESAVPEREYLSRGLKAFLLEKAQMQDSVSRQAMMFTI
jgi:hypothetical protein